MPSQIVHLPASIITAIAGKNRLEPALSEQDMWPVRETNASQPVTLRICVDPLIYAPESSFALRGDVFAVLLTSVPVATTRFLPAPMPDCTVYGILQSLEEAILGLTGFTGHQRMSIARAFETARSAPPAAPQNLPAEMPQHRHQRDVLETAARIAEVVAPAFGALAKRLEAYRKAMRRCGSDFAVGRLAWQAELGQLLHLRNTVAKPALCEPYLLAKSRRGELRHLHMVVENLTGAFDFAYGSLHAHCAETRTTLDAGFVQKLHDTIVVGLPCRTRKASWRDRPVKLKSPLNGEVSECPYSPSDVEVEMRRFFECYDEPLWRDMHPIIRAGMAHQRFVEIHPFSDGNGRTARLLVQAILLQAGWPALPLELVFTVRRHEYLRAVALSLSENDPLRFVRFLLRACEIAIERGIKMMQALHKEQRKMIAAVVQLGLPSGHARKLSEWMLCNLLTPGSEPDWIKGAPLIHEELDRTGLIEGVYHLGGVSYSANLVRRLIADELSAV
jgi:hypothetical protein